MLLSCALPWRCSTNTGHVDMQPGNTGHLLSWVLEPLDTGHFTLMDELGDRKLAPLNGQGSQPAQPRATNGRRLFRADSYVWALKVYRDWERPRGLEQTLKNSDSSRPGQNTQWCHRPRPAPRARSEGLTSMEHPGFPRAVLCAAPGDSPTLRRLPSHHFGSGR